MILVKLVLILLWLFIIPTFIGRFLINNKKDILYSWVMGNILQMAIYFVIAIPIILLKGSFRVLTVIFTVVIVILAIISIVLKVKKKEFCFRFEDVKIFLKNISIFQVIFILLLVGQLIYKIEYSNINNDDETFVTLANDIIRTDTLYLTTTTTGEISDSLNARRALAPSSAYYATISVLTNTHVTIIMHTVIPLVFICLAYSVYYYLAKRFFKEKNSIYIFLIILVFLSFYAFTVKGVNRYLYLYTWFGRAIYAGIILPLIWKLCFDAMTKDSKIMDWINVLITVLAGSLATQMSVPLTFISVMVLAIINSIKDKKISYFIKSLACVIPCVLIGVIYLLIK